MKYEWEITIDGGTVTEGVCYGSEPLEMLDQVVKIYINKYSCEHRKSFALTIKEGSNEL